MKKFIYFLIIPIFVLFNDRVFADVGTYQYLYSLDSCRLADNYMYVNGTKDTKVFVYEIFGNDFSFTYYSGNRLNVIVSPNLESTCIDNGIGSPRDRVISISSGVVISNEYTFSNRYANDSRFPHVYAYIYLSSVEGDYGSISWGTDSLPVEPEPVPPYEYEFKGLIYVPEDDVYNKCYVVQNEDVIRGYDRIPVNNSIYNYRDYYINSSYIYKDGSGQWSQYSTLPVCLDSDILTNNLYYRLDFDRSLIIFFISSIFCIYLPIKLFSKIFKKGVL